MKTFLLLTALTFQGLNMTFGQVGINTDTPDPHAALDIQSPASDNRGVLFPRMNTAQRLGITPAPAQSMFVFDTDDKLFYYYDGTKWVALVPKEPIGTHNGASPQVNGDITVTTGTISAPNITGTGTVTGANVNVTNTLTVPGFPPNALVPARVIVMWSGSIASIPAGWALCDGNNTTPNLSSRFIVSYDAAVPAYNTPGNTGGSNTIVLSKDQLPRHQHAITDGTDGAQQSNSGNHSHQLGYDDQDRSGGNTGTQLIRDFSGPDGNNTTSGAGDHRHNGITGNGASDTLNANPVDIRPSYFVLAYIMKMP